MDFALHTTSPKALAYQPTVESYDSDWLSEVSFADLLDMRDTASDEEDWDGCDEIDVELLARRAEATARLMGLFVLAVERRGVVPVVSGGVLGSTLIATYLTEVMGTNEGTELAVRMALGEVGNVIARLAADYARDNADDLLRAGWSAEQ